MRCAISLKMLYRSPGKTIITFLLLAALTFSLFLQVAEYTATAKEFAENVDMYYGTGYVEKAPASYTGYGMLQFPYYIETDPRLEAVDIPALNDYRYPPLTTEACETISTMPYISSADCRYMTAGRSQYPRLRDDDALWDYNARAIVEGNLQGPCENPIHYMPAYRVKSGSLLAGDLDMELFAHVSYFWKDAPFSIKTYSLPDGAPPLEDGELYFFPETAGPYGHYIDEDWVPTATNSDNNFGRQTHTKIKNVILNNYCYALDERDDWMPGDRYIFVFRFSHISGIYQGLTLRLYDWVSEHNWPAVYNITDAPENYLELPEYASLKKLIEITNSDLNTLDVVYADDMSTIKLVKDGKMTLTDGRWLTTEDTIADAKVCMLDEKFAQTYGLKVGDTLPLELGDALFEQFFNLGAIASVPERYADNWTRSEFEIVGLYKTAGGAFAAAKEPNWNYSVNTVFVPLSSLPETVDLSDHEYAPGEFTFRVDNAWDIAPFLEETAPKIEAMGLTLMFDDGGWMEVYKPYKEAQRIVMIRIILLAAITVMATAFVVFLFISRKKKDYAIMRALGTPKGKSNGSLLLPLMVLTAVSVIVGLSASAVYVAHAGTMGALSVRLAVLCGAVELTLALLLAFLMLHGLSRKSPLMLLQGEQTRQRKTHGVTSIGPDNLGAPKNDIFKEPQTASSAGADVPISPQKIGANCVPLRKKPRLIRFTLRYIFRHIRRSAVKSLLSVLVAALMLAAVAQLGHMRIVYDQLRSDTIVTAKFNSSIVMPRLQQLIDDGLAADPYYERHYTATMVDGPEYSDVEIEATNDIANYVGIPCELRYGAKSSLDDFLVKGKYVIIGSDIMEQYELSIGDAVYLCKQDQMGMTRFYTQALAELLVDDPGLPMDLEVVFERHPEYMERKLQELCDRMIIIGTVTTGNSTFDNMIFTSALGTEKDFQNDTLLEYVEFRVADNSRAQEMKNLGEEMTGHRSGAFSIDIEKLESVERTAGLLETLYPIVVALTLIIGAFLCALIILQTAKDAAIMRIQGTTAAMTRAILAVEQVLLALVGVAIGLSVMAAIKGRDFPLIAVRALTFGGAYIVVAAVASIVSAVLATRKNLLELLQTKE